MISTYRPTLFIHQLLIGVLLLFLALPTAAVVTSSVLLLLLPTLPYYCDVILLGCIYLLSLSLEILSKIP